MTAFNITAGDFIYKTQPDKVGDTYYRARIVRGEYAISIGLSLTRSPYCTLEITKGDHTVWADNECTPPGWEGNSLQSFIDALNRDFTIEDLYYTDTTTEARLAELQWDHMDPDRRPVKR